MATRQELLKQLEEDVEELVEVNEEEPKKSKVNKRGVALILLLLINKETKKGYITKSSAVLNKGNIKKLISDETILKSYLKEAVKRNKQIKYTRVVKKQATIFSNQVKKEGIKKATEKLKVRTNNILTNETGFFKDKAAIFSGKQIAKKTGNIVFKEWVYGKVGSSKEPRETHQAADGQRQLLTNDFIVGGVLTPGPRQFGDPSEDINCTCGIDIVVIEVN